MKSKKKLIICGVAVIAAVVLLVIICILVKSKAGADGSNPVPTYPLLPKTTATDVVVTGKSSEQEISDAAANGFVLLKDGSVVSGKELWDDFYKKAQAGKKCSIRIGYSYTLEHQNMSAELYEAEKDDYPKLFLAELQYDGKKYILSPVAKINGEYAVYENPTYNERVLTYSYLMHYSGVESSAALIDNYDYYYLTQAEDVTLKQIQYSMISSDMWDWIDNRFVYAELHWKEQQ